MKTIREVSVPDPLSVRMDDPFGRNSLFLVERRKEPLVRPYVRGGLRRAWELSPDDLAAICLKHTPEERLALLEIAGNADIIMVGKTPFLLTPVSKETLDTLMHLESELDDLEPDDEGAALDEDMEEDDPPEDNGDRELDTSDDEPSLGWTAAGEKGDSEDLEDDNDSGFADTDSLMDEEVHSHLIEFNDARCRAAFSRRIG